MAHVPLIFPHTCVIARLGTALTAADPDAAGPLISGYNPLYREPVKVASMPTDKIGTSARVELPEIQITAQVEGEQQDKLQMLVSGNSPATMFRIIAHFRELETLGLIRPDGNAAFSPGDRLVRILNKRTGATIQTFPDGLYLEQAMSRGWGLSTSGATRDLLFMDFRARDKSSR